MNGATSSKILNEVTSSKIQAEIRQSVGQMMIRQYKAECHQHIADEEIHHGAR
jgi:hypothetical protein